MIIVNALRDTDVIVDPHLGWIVSELVNGTAKDDLKNGIEVNISPADINRVKKKLFAYVSKMKVHLCNEKLFIDSKKNRIG